MTSPLAFYLTIALPLGAPVVWVLVKDLIDEARRIRNTPPRQRPAIPAPRTPLQIPSRPRHALDESTEIDGMERLIPPYLKHWQRQQERLDALAERAATTARQAIRDIAAEHP